jgi:hypothetical protein
LPPDQLLGPLGALAEALLFIGVAWRAFATKKVVFGWQYQEKAERVERQDRAIDRLTKALARLTAERRASA